MALFGDIPMPQARDIIDQMQRLNTLEQMMIANKGGGLANQYQGMINQFAPEKFTNEAAIQRGEISQYPFKNELLRQNARHAGAGANHLAAEDKYIPLKYAIEAQNSNRGNSRFGNAYQLKQMLSNMPEAERYNWIANNQEAYQKMTQDIANAGEEANKGQLLTPEFLSQFGMSGGSGRGPQGLGQPHGLATPPPSPIIPGMPGSSQEMMPSNVPGAVGMPAYLTPGANVPPQAQQSIFGQFAQQQVQENPALFKNPTLDQQEQSKLVTYNAANRKATTQQVATRAEGAAIMEKWLQDNRAEYAPRILNAVKYAGAAGRGQKYADILKREQPDAYQDYLWVKDSFQPNVVNQVKIMERMGATDSQREEMHNMVTAIDNIQNSPKTTLKVMNRSLASLGDIARSTFATAQPVKPGVLEKMYGLHDVKGDYISEDYVKSLKKENTTAAEKAAIPLTVTYEGKEYIKKDGEWYPK